MAQAEARVPSPGFGLLLDSDRTGLTRRLIEAAYAIINSGDGVNAQGAGPAPQLLPLTVYDHGHEVRWWWRRPRVIRFCRCTFGGGRRTRIEPSGIPAGRQSRDTAGRSWTGRG